VRNLPTAGSILPPVDDAALYSIGAVARMTGVAVGTLRTWEDRYQLVIATRSSGGQRRYSRRQLEQLLFVAGEVEAGTSPGDAHRLLADRDDREGSRPLERPADSAVGILILVAERDPFAASYVDYFLRTEGYHVELVCDAEQAERRFAQLAPQLVIVELLLSGGLGGALIEKLKQSSALVVAVSPLAAAEVSAALGADAFLQKPIDPMTLLSTVRDLLGTSALTASRLPAAS
jgi:DNA-binding transcriptional MerR regulator